VAQIDAQSDQTSDQSENWRAWLDYQRGLAEMQHDAMHPALRAAGLA